jgi:hypothetical protein
MKMHDIAVTLFGFKADHSQITKWSGLYPWEKRKSIVANTQDFTNTWSNDPIKLFNLSLKKKN